MFSSDDPWAIIITLTPLDATAEKTLAAIPGDPFIPAPTTARTETSGSTLTPAFIPTCERPSDSAEAARSRELFLTTALMLDSDTLCDIISTFTPALPSNSKILAAVPGLPTRVSPETVTIPTLSTKATDFAIAELFLSRGLISVPRRSGLNPFLMRTGIPAFLAGASASGCMFLAPKKPISSASA